MANPSDYAVYVASPKSYKLRFLKEIASPVVTGKKDGKGIEASDGYIEVELVDIETDQPVVDGPLASKQVKLVLLPENFGVACVWTPSEFKNSIRTHWGKKKNILLGDLSIELKHGRGTVGKIWIKHDKNHFSKAKFRLGAMIDDCSYEIKEAITEPFEIKDRRSELTSKNRSLTLDDKVARLKNIGRRGPCFKRLMNENIKTVKDFLDRLSSNPVALQKIYGSSGKRWEQTVRHAKTSISDRQCNACESVASSVPHGPEIAPILVNDHDGATELEVGSYEPSPSSNETMSITFDPSFVLNELLYEDPYYGLNCGESSGIIM